MRDSVSGKLMRDSVTGKLMRYNPIGDDCQYCSAGETPEKIRIPFGGFVDCENGCKDLGGGPDDFWKQITDGSQFNGQTYTLEQTEANACKWSKDISGNYGTIENWRTLPPYEPPYTCDELIESRVYDILRIEVTKTGNTSILVNAWLICSGNPSGVGGTILFFNFSGDVSGVISDCINISSIANSITSGGVAPSILIAKVGTAQIQEVS